MPLSLLGDAMKRRSRSGGAPARSRRSKSSKLKSRNTAMAVADPSPRRGGESEVAQLRRELHEAREQQTAISEVQSGAPD
jgi:hypothetical protein